jgi:very-short-patch-repair endonuclease
VLERATPRVLRVGGAPKTAHQQLVVAVLDAGSAAVASHRAAAWLWRLPGFPFVVETTRLRDSASRGLGRIHEPRLLLPHHVTVYEAIPVTSLGRTIFDLAAVIHPDRLARVVDYVITRSPAMGGVLHDMLPELAKRGRTGITVMRQVLADRPRGLPVPATGLERRFEEILRNAGERVPRRQVDVGGDTWIGRVDYRDEDFPILFEIDSRTFHTGLLDAEADRQRDEALYAAGWFEVVRITEDEIWRRPWVVVEKVRAARARARLLFRSGA